MDAATSSATALKLTAKFGVATNLLRTANARGPNGSRTITPANVPVNFAPEESSFRVVDGKQVRSITGYIAGGEPTIGDDLPYAGSTYRISGVDALDLNGTAVCWKVTVVA